MRCFEIRQRRFALFSFGYQWSGEEHPRSSSPVHIAYVPDKSALACQAQLQRVLAGEDCSNQLQLQDELHAVELSRPTS